MDPEEEKKTHESGFPKKETKYGNCEATMWVEIQEGNKGDSVSEYSKLIVLMWPAINEDGEEVEDDEVYYKTMDEASEFWNKQIDDYFNNSDTKLKEHFQRFLKDYQ